MHDFLEKNKSIRLAGVQVALAWTVYAIVECLFSSILPWFIKPTHLYIPTHWGFTGLLFLFYPILEDIGKRRQTVIIGFERFEEVARWDSQIYNFILDRLLESLIEVNIRFIVFVQSIQKPCLYRGSAEEYSSNTVTFYLM